MSLVVDQDLFLLGIEFEVFLGMERLDLRVGFELGFPREWVKVVEFEVRSVLVERVELGVESVDFFLSEEVFSCLHLCCFRLCGLDRCRGLMGTHFH